MGRLQERLPRRNRQGATKRELMRGGQNRHFCKLRRELGTLFARVKPFNWPTASGRKAVQGHKARAFKADVLPIDDQLDRKFKRLACAGCHQNLLGAAADTSPAAKVGGDFFAQFKITKCIVQSAQCFGRVACNPRNGSRPVSGRKKRSVWCARLQPFGTWRHVCGLRRSRGRPFNYGGNISNKISGAWTGEQVTLCLKLLIGLYDSAARNAQILCQCAL